MLTWLDQRTGIVTQAKDFLTEDVPGGASYWYTCVRVGQDDLHGARLPGAARGEGALAG